MKHAKSTRMTLHWAIVLLFILALGGTAYGITIGPPPPDPVAVATTGASSVNEGTMVTLDGSGSFGSTPLTCTWAQNGTDAFQVDIIPGTAPCTATFTAPDVTAPTSLNFTLTVSNSNGSSTATVAVQIEPVNHAPVAKAVAIPSTVFAGNPVTLDGSGSFDPDNDPLTYQWTQIGNPGDPQVQLSDASAVSPTFTAPAVSSTTSLSFQLTVSDGSLSSIATVQATVQKRDDPPVCSKARAVPGVIWPPNHKMVPVGIAGVSDPDNDTLSIAITGVTQDEPLNYLGDGNTSPDASLSSNGQLSVRAERSGLGDGRVYHIGFTATDPSGESCSGTVTLCVPHDNSKAACTDGGPIFNSFGTP